MTKDYTYSIKSRQASFKYILHFSVVIYLSTCMSHQTNTVGFRFPLNSTTVSAFHIDNCSLFNCLFPYKMICRLWSSSKFLVTERMHATERTYTCTLKTLQISLHQLFHSLVGQQQKFKGNPILNHCWDCLLWEYLFNSI